MSSLFASLGIARQAILAQQMGLDVTQNNISNVNTPGYTRQRANFAPGDPTAHHIYQAGMGVRLESVDSYRDRVLDYRVNQELQRKEELSSSLATLRQIEAILNEHSGVGLQGDITAFFNSFSSLANAPEDAYLRQQVLARADQMGAKFKTIYEQIQSMQTLQDRSIVDAVKEINSITAGIARLNGEIPSARGSTGNDEILRDQRQQLLDRLAGLVDITYIETESGSVTVMTRQGLLLAVGVDSHALEVSSSPVGNRLEVRSSGVDVTSRIESGKLGGLLKTRDNVIAGYLQSLDDLAASIISQVNAQHVRGSDLNGDEGDNFFRPFAQPLPGSNLGAARSIQVAISDGAKIAAGEAGLGPGSNANAKLLAGLQKNAFVAGTNATFEQYYAGFVFRIGLDTRTASEGLMTQETLLAQLQYQRDMYSGVSLDEEAVNLLRFQRAYEANARLIRVLDGLTEEIMRILGA